MANALLRLTAMCMLAAFGDQMTGDGPMKGGVRLIVGLLAAEMILEMVLMLPASLFG